MKTKQDRPKSKSKKARLTLELSVPTRESLDRLQGETGATSVTEVLRRAIAMFEIVVQEKRKGAEVILRRPDGHETSIFVIG